MDGRTCLDGFRRCGWARRPAGMVAAGVSFREILLAELCGFWPAQPMSGWRRPRLSNCAHMKGRSGRCRDHLCRPGPRDSHCSRCRCIFRRTHDWRPQDRAAHQPEQDMGRAGRRRRCSGSVHYHLLFERCRDRLCRSASHRAHSRPARRDRRTSGRFLRKLDEAARQNEGFRAISFRATADCSTEPTA